MYFTQQHNSIKIETNGVETKIERYNTTSVLDPFFAMKGLGKSHTQKVGVDEQSTNP